MSDHTKAVCWELATSSSSMLGMRILLAGQFVGTQHLSAENARPRWQIMQFSTAAAATENAVHITEAFEKDWVATLVVPPGEIVIHPSETAAMFAGKPISPALRARIFTSLQRRDPRVTPVTTVSATGATSTIVGSVHAAPTS